MDRRAAYGRQRPRNRINGCSRRKCEFTDATNTRGTFCGKAVVHAADYLFRNSCDHSYREQLSIPTNATADQLKHRPAQSSDK